MMTSLSPYLSFSGNCREAMEFYRSCIGGELRFQTIGDSPLSRQMPERMKSRILHATLQRENLLLMASDIPGEEGLQCGNTVSLLMDCSSETELRDCYANLAQGGNATHPVHTSFWGALFGDLADKYGNRWLLHFDGRPAGKEKY